MKLHSIAALMAGLIASPPRSGIPAMTSILKRNNRNPCPVHEIEGGGYWAEVRSLPGWVAQAETLKASGKAFAWRLRTGRLNPP